MKNSWRLEHFILSLFGIGYFPYAPGTMGSLATLPLLYLFASIKLPPLFLLPPFLLLTLGLLFLVDILQKKEKFKDPSWIVIDEFIGMLTAWIIFPADSFITLTLLFLFFRFFDITKIYPVSYFDSMDHGAGVILDDVMAGVYTGLLMQLCAYFFSL